MKINTDGNIEWQKRYSFGWGTNCEAMTALKGGGFAILNRADSCRFIDPKNGSSWLIVTDSLGEVQLEKCFPKETLDYCASMIQLDNGDLILAGPSTGGSVWLLCMDTTGEIQWRQTYHDGFCRSLIPTHDGSFLLVGLTYELYVPFNSWIMKVDSMGVQQWLRYYGGEDNDCFGDAIADSLHNIIVVGVVDKNLESSPPFQPLRHSGWLLVTDSIGGIRTERIYDLADETLLSAVQEVSDRGYLIFGAIGEGPDSSREYSNILLRVDMDGDTLWTRTEGDGWENADPITLGSGEVIALPEYLESTFLNNNKSFWLFKATNRLKPVFSWFHEQDSTGQLGYPAAAGMLVDGYYLCASYQYPAPPDSVWEKIFENGIQPPEDN
ncbi:hypothetical protein KKG66_05990 [bacterium]|nr:hypothetical protein [bacterium]